MSTRTMTCGRARRLLWPDGGPRPVSPESVAAEQHLTTCAACREFVDEIRTLSELIRDVAPREEAPPAVRERLFDSIARARSGAPPSIRQRGLLLTAAIIAFLAVIGGALAVGRLGSDAESSSIAAIVQDHARALGGPHIVSTDVREVTRWLETQVLFAIHVPALPGARLRGARVSEIAGRNAAVVEYQLGTVTVAYFVVPNDGRTIGDTPPRFHGLTQSGFHVVWWREPGLLHAMIGNTSEIQLTALARACVEQARRAVALMRSRVRIEEG